MNGKIENNCIHILFVLNLLSKRGAQIQLFNLINKLPAKVKVTVFAFSNEHTYPEFVNSRKINFYPNHHKGKYNILKAYSLVRCFTTERFDVVVTLGLGASLFLGRICAVLFGVSVIYTTLHQFRRFNTDTEQYFETPNRLLNWLLPNIPGKRVFRFLPVSEMLSQTIKKNLRRYPVQTLNNGIPLSDIERLARYQPNDTIVSIEAELNEKLTIIQVGSIDDNKNQIFTLKVIGKLQRQIPNLHYLVVGEGPRKQMLEEQTTNAGLEGSVTFTGRLERMDCLYLISRSDILVLTSNSEAFPNVLVESQAGSIPVVTFEVGGASEIVRNDVTGYVVKRMDQGAFTKKILFLLNNELLRLEMGKRGKKLVLNHLTIEKKVEKLLALIKTDRLQ